MLFNPSVWIPGVADVGPTFEFRVDAVEQVDTEKVFYNFYFSHGSVCEKNYERILEALSSLKYFLTGKKRETR